jgi:hypothetical protein
MAEFGATGLLEVTEVSGAAAALEAELSDVSVDVTAQPSQRSPSGGGGELMTLAQERNGYLETIVDELQSGGMGGGGGGGGLPFAGGGSLLGGLVGGGGAGAGSGVAGGLLGGGTLATGGALAGGAAGNLALSGGALVGLERLQRENSGNPLLNRGAEAGQQAIQNPGGVVGLMGGQGPGQIGFAIGEQAGDALKQRVQGADLLGGAENAIAELEGVDPLADVQWPDAPDPLNNVQWPDLPQPQQEYWPTLPSPGRGFWPDLPELPEPDWLSALDDLVGGGPTSRPGRQGERPRIDAGTTAGIGVGPITPDIDGLQERVRQLEQALGGGFGGP